MLIENMEIVLLNFKVVKKEKCKRFVKNRFKVAINENRISE
jgi:hypothetical protein